MSTPDDQETNRVVPAPRPPAMVEAGDEGPPTGSTGEDAATDADGGNRSAAGYERSSRVRTRLIILAVCIALVATTVVVLSMDFGRDEPAVTAPVAAATTQQMPSVSTLPDVLYQQGQALVAGDLTGWLSFLDPNDTELANQFRYMFDVLHNLGVTGWKPRLTAPELARLGGFEGLTTVDMLTTISYCIQIKDCQPDLAVGNHTNGSEGFIARVSWVFETGAYRINKFQVQPPSENAFLPPWLVTNVTVATGERVSVAVPQDLLGRLPAVLAAADRAAKVADKYTKLIRPARYIVYLAGPTEWDTWYHSTKPKRDALGYAIETSRSSQSVVVKSTDVPDAKLDLVLGHEFGHVVSLLGDSYGYDYLQEGFAEFVEEDGRPVNTYYRLDDVRRFLRSGGWDGDIDHIHPYAAGLEGTAGYGLGYLTWRCIQSQYGDDTMWTFARQAFRVYQPPDAAAQQVFGQPWPTVKAACASYIRAAAR